MDDLITFLRARLDEDERNAEAASPGPWRVDDETYPESIYSAEGYSIVSGGRWGETSTPFDREEDARFIARQHPARVLADVAAKRQIIDQWQFEDGPGWYEGYRDAYERTLRLLALPYAGHPDYREDWKP